jgi:cbb3-type cytochrome oxidase maturation protein
MDVMFILIGASITVAVTFLLAFLWAVKSGQYDDRYTPSVRILFEDNIKRELNKKYKEQSRREI